MGRGRQAQAVKLSREERKSLELLTRRGTAEQRQVMRAQIALMAHRGESTTAIAQALGVSVQTVSHWRTRLVRHGVEGLQEVSRPGRPRRIGEAQRLELLALACEPAEPDGRATPTLDELVERDRARRNQADQPQSFATNLASGRFASAPGQAVAAQSRPPVPTEVQRDLRTVPPGSQALGRAIDEKTGIQAIERKHADRAPQPAHVRRREFEYIRHGTQALTAALDVHSGRVIGSCTDRRTQADLVAFMEQVALAYPKCPVHIVWDNLNTHRAQAVWHDFNARHDRRFVFHFTPLHASWVNQIELLFGIYSRRVLRHARHVSIEQLRRRTEAFIAQRNRAPKPFKWTFAGFELQTGEPLRVKEDANIRRPKKGR
jgi:transposase